MFAGEREASQHFLLDWLVGQHIGAYSIEALAGYGQLNAVYQAHHLKSDEQVIVTVFTLPTNGDVERYLERFRQEAEAIRLLSHPGLLPLISYGQYHGHPYFVTPAASGTTLAEVLAKEGCFSLDQVLGVLEQIAPALDYLQEQGVIHQYLRPTSFLRTENGTILLTGLGMMRVLAAEGIVTFDQPYSHLCSILGTYLGDPASLAPERVMGRGVDTRGDMYALGVMLYELFTGRPPFSGTQDSFLQACLQSILQHPFPLLTTLRPDLPADLDAVVKKAMALQPSARFPHASALLEAFRGARQANEQVTAERDERRWHEQGRPEPITEQIALEQAFARSCSRTNPMEGHVTGESNRELDGSHRTVALSTLRTAPWLESRFFNEQAISDLAMPRCPSTPGPQAEPKERLTSSPSKATAVFPFSTREREMQIAHGASARAQWLRLTALVTVRSTVIGEFSRLFQRTEQPSARDIHQDGSERQTRQPSFSGESHAKH